MAEYLKQAARKAASEQRDVTAQVRALLAEIAAGGEAAAQAMARRFDGWQGEVVVSPVARAEAADLLPAQIKADIGFAHDNIRRFAQAQRATIRDTQV